MPKAEQCRHRHRGYAATLAIALVFMFIFALYPAEVFADDYTSINTITGIRDGESFQYGAPITFTAVGQNASSSSPVAGDIRYLPDKWELFCALEPFASGTWSAASFSVCLVSLEMGDYQLHVRFRKQLCESTGAWTDTGDFDYSAVDFYVDDQAAEPSSALTVSPGDVVMSESSGRYYSGEQVAFCCVGVGMEVTAAQADSKRYRPVSWALALTCDDDSSVKVERSGVFDKPPYAASVTADAATFTSIGDTYSGTLTVEFMLESFNGAAWVTSTTTVPVIRQIVVDTAPRPSDTSVSAVGVVNTISGITDAQTIELMNDGIEFTAVGQGMDNTQPSEGATRFRPYMWMLQSTSNIATPCVGGWADDSFSAMLSGDVLSTGSSYRLFVSFCGQYYSDGQWKDSATVTESSIAFAVAPVGGLPATTTQPPQSTTTTTAPVQDEPSATDSGGVVFVGATREENLRTLMYFAGGVYGLAMLLVIGLVIRRIKITSDQRKAAEEKLLQAQMESLEPEKTIDEPNAEGMAYNSQLHGAAPYDGLTGGFVPGLDMGYGGMSTGAVDSTAVGGYGRFGSAYEKSTDDAAPIPASAGKPTPESVEKDAKTEEIKPVEKPVGYGGFGQVYEQNPIKIEMPAAPYDPAYGGFDPNMPYEPAYGGFDPNAPYDPAYGGFDPNAPYDPAYVGFDPNMPYDPAYGGFDPNAPYDPAYGGFDPNAPYDPAYAGFDPNAPYDPSYGGFDPNAPAGGFGTGGVEVSEFGADTSVPPLILGGE